jgi:dihydrofolate reductase
VTGRLIYNFNISLDGFAAAADGGLDWATVDDELHSWFNERQAAVQASLYGRKLYDLMAAYWPTAGTEPSATAVEREFARIWNATPKVVFSTTLGQVEHNSRLVRGDIPDVLEQLRTEFDGDLDVGGPTLAGQFIQRGLVDEYRLVVHPVVLGGGLPFWPALAEPIRLRLVETRRFGNGAELRSYVPR